MKHVPGSRLDSARRIVGLLLLAALVGTVAAGAQDEETRRHGIFVDTLDVSLVNIEVVALENDRPVNDLVREDFEIFDDGQPVEVTNFYRVEGGQRILPAADLEAGGEATRLAQVPERSFVVVLVDHAFIAPSSRAKIFHELKKKLDDVMVDGTQVMVISKRREIELVQRPTTDRVEVAAALDRLSKIATSDFQSQVRRIVREIDQGLTIADLQGTNLGEVTPLTGENDLGAAEGDALYTLNLARSYSREVYHEVRHSVRVLRGFLGSLAGLPGRKAVLYVADRLPLRPGEVVWNVWYSKYGFDHGSDYGVPSVESMLREFETSHEVRDLIADATAGRIAFYPVGAGPESSLNALSAENKSPSITAGALSEITVIDSGLNLLAEATGGQAATGSGNPGWLFDRLTRDMTNYYSLAYASPHRGDGKKHKIEVKVKRPGVKLHYLESYRDKSGDQEMNELTHASLVLGMSENPLGVEVIPGEFEKQKGGEYLMQMQVRFPISKLVLLPQEKAHVGRVSIVFLVRDKKGRLSEPVKVLVPIEVPHDGILQALSQNAVYVANLAIRSGEQTVAVGVHDDLGSISSTVNVNVKVGGSRG